MSRIKGNILRIKDFSFFIPTEIKEIENFTFKTKVILISNEKKDFSPKLCIIENTSVPEYDYDYEDNLTYMGETTNTIFHPIENNPYDGTKITFIVQEVINLTSEYLQIIDKIKKTEKMRYSLKRNNLLSELSKELNLLLKDIPNCFELDKTQIYSEENQLYIVGILEEENND